jgi:hypothetical protein
MSDPIGRSVIEASDVFGVCVLRLLSTFTP